MVGWWEKYPRSIALGVSAGGSHRIQWRSSSGVGHHTISDRLINSSGDAFLLASLSSTLPRGSLLPLGCNSWSCKTE